MIILQKWEMKVKLISEKWFLKQNKPDQDVETDFLSVSGPCEMI